MNKLSAYFLICLLAFFGVACADNEAYQETDEMDEVAEAETDTYGTDMTDPAGTSSYYDTWDLDRNAELTEDEFNEGFASASSYGDWDADDNDLLDDDEFAGGFFTLWDRDRSGALEEGEWNENGPMWYGDAWDENVYTDWDADASGTLTEDEFAEGIGDEGGLFHSWDLDGDGLTVGEYHSFLFNAWDTDRNGILTREEFDAGYGVYDYDGVM